MHWKFVCTSIVSACLTFACSSIAMAATGGTTVVRVTTTPVYREATVKFSGSPAGEIRLDQNGTGTISTQVDAGRNLSTLVRIDPALVSAGYLLTEILCDDVRSARRSSGNVQNSKATFEVEDGETVTCTFSLQQPSLACKCPKKGRWNVVNNTGSMACTGVVSMTQPLKASRSTGTLDVNDRCDTILAEGMSDDEADITMRLQPDCSWKGAVGGEQDGIPMTINFRWNVEDQKHITGNLDSTISQQGMTCKMSRSFALDFES